MGAAAKRATGAKEACRLSEAADRQGTADVATPCQAWGNGPETNYFQIFKSSPKP